MRWPSLLLFLSAAPAAAFPLPQREVAKIVSPAWANEDSRDRAGEATTVMRLLGVKSGQTVADIGAGSGYYTMRVSPVVGPGGRVIAQDIVPKYVHALKARVRKAGLRNVVFVQGSPVDPRLPRGAVDIALLIHMYHEIAQPYALLYKLRASLKPDGRVAIVDLDRPSEQHGMPRALLVCEVKAVGYDLVSIAELKPGYLAVFKPAAPVDPATVKACRA
jgi:ubiquinone/menaquinone biosynthesis C-methylase UbiE